MPLETIRSVRSERIKGGMSGPVLHRLFIEKSTDAQNLPSTLVAKYFAIQDLPARDMVERLFATITKMYPEALCKREGAFH